jgi:hypothetical protein
MHSIPATLADFFHTGGGVVCLSAGGEFSADQPKPLALLPGSFNPLHHGHRRLAEVAGRRLGCEVQYELSVTNVDKPELTMDVVAERVRQFVGAGSVWITRAAGVLKKSDLFPGAAFVLGFDTAVRLIDPKYYGSEQGRDVALAKLLERGCRVVVGGRIDGAGEFRVWEDRLAGEFRDLFDVIPEGDFRVDVSSTQLRANPGSHAGGAVPDPAPPA